MDGTGHCAGTVSLLMFVFFGTASSQSRKFTYLKKMAKLYDGGYSYLVYTRRARHPLDPYPYNSTFLGYLFDRFAYWKHVHMNTPVALVTI